jgi:putative methyltransferase (TIGR04325 family)
MKLKDLILPLIFGASRPNPQSPFPEYRSFASALQDSDTYEDSGVIEVVSLKTEAYRRSLTTGTLNVVSNRQTVQNMFVISYLEALYRPIRVLELGGACGASYFEMDHLLPGRIGAWAVVETSLMTAAGRTSFQNDKIKFFDDLNEAALELGDFDLLIAQGVLQYCSNPLQTLSTLLTLKYRYIYLTRTTVATGNTGEGPVITRQETRLSEHGPGTLPEGIKDRRSTQPLTIIPYESISSQISASCNTLFRFEESESAPLLIGLRTVTTKNVGFLAAKAAAGATLNPMIRVG